MAHLSDEELEDAQNLIDAAPPDKYELEVLYGQFWSAIPDPTGFGRRFKTSVVAGALIDIEWFDRNIENHQIYSVKGG